MILNRIVSTIKEAKNICILPHISADGDAIGSSLALYLALEKISKKAVILLEEDVAYTYSFLPAVGRVQVYDNKPMDFDVVVALDTGDLGRLGARVDVFNNARVTINIDHHSTNTEFAFYNHVSSASSAVGEIIYDLIKAMDVSFDEDISTCLYVAIATDTGGFKYSNTTKTTHQIAGNLIGNGVKVADISRIIFDTQTPQKVKLMGEAINSLELLENGKVSFITISDKAMKDAGAKEEDCDGIVNIGRSIKGVEVAVMMRQKESGVIKVNFRSNKYVDVSKIAGMYGGGGHKMAAGCLVEKNVNVLKEMILKDIKEVL